MKMKMSRFTLTWLMALVALVCGSVPIMAYTIQGHAVCQTPGLVPYGAVVKVFEVDPLPGGGYTVDEIPLTATPVVDTNGDFTVTSTSPFGTGGFEAWAPDLIFVMVQNLNGAIETIYQEEATILEVHWNVVDGSNLSFTVDSNAFGYNPSVSPFPNDKSFVFTRVGSCPTAEIDCKGSFATSEGYNRPRKAPYGFSGLNSDQPFGRTMDLFGGFGNLANLDYYKVQYSTDGGTTWTDVKTNLPNYWYDRSSASSLDWHWVSEAQGPHSFGTVDNLYTIPYRVRPGVYWSYLDRIARFDSTLAANGLCKIRIKGYKTSGSNVIQCVEKITNPASYDIDPDVNYGSIYLQVDNTPPSVLINFLKLNGVNVPPCQIIDFGDPDTLSIDFRVWDERGHLRDFKIDVMYGHNQYVSTYPAGAQDDYGPHGSPTWQGSTTYITSYTGTAFNSTIMPTCAYQFRLHASKRTTNGYGLIYDWVEDTWHITIQRY